MPGFSSSLYRFPDNAAVEASLLEMELSGSLESPAVGLSAAFICPPQAGVGPIGEIKEAHIHRDGETIFMGRVDKQRVSQNAKGSILRLECRSKGALLLDNEARPASYFNVDADTVFAVHIAPYGFRLRNPGGNKNKYLPAYTVRKGMSEWEAFCAFASRAYGIAPYAKGTEIILAPPESASPGILISNSGAGEKFEGLEYSFTPYNMISRIYLRDALGSYSSAVDNPIAGYYGIERKRYMIPPGSFIESGGADAISRVKSSLLAREDIQVTLPGIIGAELGQRAGIDGAMGIFEKYGLMVGEWTYKMGKSGYRTILKLIRTDG